MSSEHLFHNISTSIMSGSSSCSRPTSQRCLPKSQAGSVSKMNSNQDVSYSHDNSSNHQKEDTLAFYEERQRQLELRVQQQEHDLQRLQHELKRRARNERLDDDKESVINTNQDDVINNKNLSRTAKAELLPPNPGTKAPAVESHTLVSSLGRAIVFGGTISDENGIPYPQNDVHVLTIASGRWKRMECEGDIPCARQGHASVLIGSREMMVFGGYGTNGLTGTMYVLDIGTFTWREIPPSSEDGDIIGIKSHSLVVLKSKVYLFGGCTAKGRINVVRCFDLNARKWLSQEPFNQQLKEYDEALRASEIRKEATDISSPPGHADEDAACDLKINKLIEFDMEKKKENHRLVANIPKPRSGHTATAYPYKNSFVVFGGRIGKFIFSNDTYLYDVETLRWEKLYCSGEVPSVRCDHTAVIFNGCLYVFGGYSITAAGEKVFYNDLYYLSLLSQVWFKVEIEADRRHGVPPIGCSRGGLLFENPSGNICLLMHGGWVASVHKCRRGRSSQGVTFGPTDVVWVLDFGVKLTRRKRKFVSLSFLAKPPVNRHRIEVSENLSESGKKNIIKEIGNCKTQISLSSKITSEKQPGDSMQQEFKHSTPIRSQEELDKIVSRLSDTRIREKHMAELEKKYLFTRKQTDVNLEDQEDSVMRLYEEAEIRRAKLKELDRKFYPSPPPKEVDDADIYESVIRLSRLPPRYLPLP